LKIEISRLDKKIDLVFSGLVVKIGSMMAVMMSLGLGAIALML
jgi:hypothetical protein